MGDLGLRARCGRDDDEGDRGAERRSVLEPSGHAAAEEAVSGGCTPTAGSTEGVTGRVVLVGSHATQRGTLR